jgi:Ca2+-binding RTX toxin-like protein
LRGGISNDKLTGGLGDDLLDGGAGNDTFYTARTPDGADTEIGGTGSDTANYGGRIASVVLSPGGGADDGAPGEHDDIGADVEKLIAGKGADTLSDGDLVVANIFKGGGGSDTIEAQDGVEGNDQVLGGGGTDTCSADPGDVVQSCP